MQLCVLKMKFEYKQQLYRDLSKKHNKLQKAKVTLNIQDSGLGLFILS